MEKRIHVEKDPKLNRNKDTWPSGIPPESSLASLCPLLILCVTYEPSPQHLTRKKPWGLGGMEPRPRSLKYFLLPDGHLTFVTCPSSQVLSGLGGRQRPGLSLCSTGAPLKDVGQKPRLQICQAEMAKNNQDHGSLGQDAILG